MPELESTFFPAFAANDGAPFRVGVNIIQVHSRNLDVQPEAIISVGFYVASERMEEVQASHVMNPLHAEEFAKQILGIVEQLRSMKGSPT
jgi:hypothetical protein